ncbi:hypothetical protein [Maricaulis sp.]|uniref:hypothetical protein n=1 Tax=Maricaulis sp. TaxID=1486257 RepID=UPI003296DED8
MYTEDGFELRPIGDTMEIYASGEQFHETRPPVIAAFQALTSRMPVTKVLCDVRLATYVLDPTELEMRARATARALAGYRTALVCLANQHELMERTASNIRSQGGTAELFSGKGAAREWLAGKDGCRNDAKAATTV